jgi:RND family efflux transporter MFP subunit
VHKDSTATGRVAVSVETLVVQPDSFADVINVVGTVKPAEDIMVASEEGGKVSRWFVDKGAYVKEGQTILKLNDDLLRSQLAAAEAQYNIAKLNAEKSSEVYADAGAVSEVSVKTAKYSVDAAAANVELLKTRIAKTTITAPLSGRINDRLVDVGEMVAPGAPVARLLQTGTVKVTAGVPERYVEGVRLGLPVEMTFDALQGKKVSGRITYVGGSVSDRDRTVPIEVEIGNPGNAFTPEMVANLRIVKDELRGVIAVPRTAVARIENGYQVYVVTQKGSENIVEARPVTLGPADNGMVVITSGLNPAERIVTVGQAKVNPGEPVIYQ